MALESIDNYRLFDDVEFAGRLREALDFRAGQDKYLDYVEAVQRNYTNLDWITQVTKLPDTLDEAVGGRPFYVSSSRTYQLGMRLAFHGVLMTSFAPAVPAIRFRSMKRQYPEFVEAMARHRAETGKVGNIWSVSVEQLGEHAYSETPLITRNVLTDWTEELYSDSRKVEYFKKAFCVATAMVRRTVDHGVRDRVNGVIDEFEAVLEIDETTAVHDENGS